MVDVRTFMLVLAIGNIALALLMAVYFRGTRPPMPMRIWKWSKLVQGAAHALGFARPDLGLAWVDMLANTLLVAGVALESGAYAAFLQLPRWKRVIVPVAVLSILVIHVARLSGAAPAGMVALVSAPLTLFTALTAWMLLVQPGGGSALQRLIGWNDVLFLLVIGVRTWTAAVNGGFGVFSGSAVHTLTYVTGFVVLVVNGFGFLLLCKERDDRRLEELATRDGLTGLLNRRAFFERTELARTLSARLHKPLALMMLDIDHFKRLNDRFGHAAGDEALCVFARTVGAGLRDHDIVARLGGEEFALVMPGTSLAGALQAAERVRAAVAAAPVLTDGAPCALTVSIGVVLVAEREQLNAALARADEALYAAKSGGRNRVACGEVEQQLVWE